jgi:hypothetical protein
MLHKESVNTFSPKLNSFEVPVDFHSSSRQTVHTFTHSRFDEAADAPTTPT